MTDNITIRAIPGGWRVTRFKQAGVDKGEISLATTCGGMLGKLLAVACAQAAAQIGMIDTILLDLGDGDISHIEEA